MSHHPTPMRGASRIAIVAALAGVAMSACQPSNPSAAVSSAPAPLAAIPLATSGAPPIVPAPEMAALPPAPRANVGRLANTADRYAFADRAYAMESAFGDAPPDYTFDYADGQRPWAWQGDDHSTRFAEPLPSGGYRYYYYEPGAQTPYLVRDPGYSYAYDNGALVVVYDSHGRALPSDELDRQADLAGRVLARAEAIYLASQRQRREAVAAANWAARRSQIDAERAQWAADQAADQDWRAYHAQHDQQEQAQWSAEQYRREAQAARFAQNINDPQLAAQDWQAAQQAHARATADQTQSSARSGPFGFGRPPQPQTPGQQQQVQLPQQPQPGAAGPVNATGGPYAGRSGAAQVGASQAQLAAETAAAQAQAAKLAAERQAQAQAQLAAQTAAAQARARLAAERQAQAQHQAQLAAQAAAVQAAKLAAERQAQAQHQGQLAAQATAAQAAKLAAERQAAQLQAQHQAQLAAQAAAAQAARLAAERQAAQLQAQHQAQLAAQAAAAQTAKLAAERQAAQLQAQHQGQLAAQATAAQAAKLAAERQAAQLQAQHQAQLAAQAAAAQAAKLAAERQAAQLQAQHQAELVAAQQAKTPPQPTSAKTGQKRPPSNSVESGQPAGHD